MAVTWHARPILGYVAALDWPCVLVPRMRHGFASTPTRAVAFISLLFVKWYLVEWFDADLERIRLFCSSRSIRDVAAGVGWELGFG